MQSQSPTDPAEHHHGMPRRERVAPLWQQLQQLAQWLQAVQDGQSATAALTRVEPALRPAVQALGYQVLRQWGVARWLRRQLVPRSPPPLLDALLTAALALCQQVAAEDAPGTAGAAGGAPAGKGSHARDHDHAAVYTDFTLVNQAVDAARRHAGMKHQSGLVNAVLRRFLRERTQWVQACQQQAPLHDAALLNLPAWWWQHLLQDYRQAVAQEIAHQGLRPAPMTLRVNARHMTAAEYLHRHLPQAGLSGQPNGRYGITLDRACPVQQLPGFAQGWVSVQDAAAQLAAPLLLDALAAGHAGRCEPWRLLDACAAPGGKTAHLLELGDHDVTALEIDPARTGRIHQNLARLGLQATVLTADAADTEKWGTAAPFDGILLDAPCTASGIVRRHPDVPWLRRKEDIAALAAQQRRLLDALWPLVHPGGVLLYCTCSVFKAEGQEQINAFLLRHTDALALPAPGHLLPLHAANQAGVSDNNHSRVQPQVPELIDHDGFYYALLARKS